MVTEARRDGVAAVDARVNARAEVPVSTAVNKTVLGLSMLCETRVKT